jgi:hypothetical protein
VSVEEEMAGKEFACTHASVTRHALAHVGVREAWSSHYAVAACTHASVTWHALAHVGVREAYASVTAHALMHAYRRRKRGQSRIPEARLSVAAVACSYTSLLQLLVRFMQSRMH